jgi:hypothetical protein
MRQRRDGRLINQRLGARPDSAPTAVRHAMPAVTVTRPRALNMMAPEKAGEKQGGQKASSLSLDWRTLTRESTVSC